MVDGHELYDGLNVLVVDDEPATCMALAKLLRAYGCEVTTASDGQQACELYAKQLFDCVLLDIEMPGIDGYETARRLRRQHRSDDIWVPIILVTGLAGETSLVQGIDAGADDYLVKPVSVRTLLAKLWAMRRLADHQNRLRSSKLKLERLALQDALTGLANRRRFDEHLRREWQRQCRFGRTLSLLLIDIDYFKHYNDYFGHQSGRPTGS